MTEPTGENAPTIFTMSAFKKISKPYLITALVASKVNEEKLNSRLDEINATVKTPPKTKKTDPSEL